MQNPTSQNPRGALSLSVIGQQAIRALYVVTLMTVIAGLIYPAIITGLAQAIFPYQANGSLITLTNESTPRGSALIGQSFENTQLFSSRPSAVDYNGSGSGGTNWSITHPSLATAIDERAAHLQQKHITKTIPIDLLTASASGLDPHISLMAAYYQLPHVAQATGIPVSKLENLILANTHTSIFGGPAYVNVMLLNKSILDQNHHLVK